MAHDYVLAAAPQERTQIKLHCKNCPRCRALVDDLIGSAALLAFSSTFAAPPAAAKTALFNRIAQASRDFPVIEPVFQGSMASLTSPTIPSSREMFAPAASDTQLQAPAGRRSWWSMYAAPLATLPLLFALGFVGYWGINARMDLSDQTNNVEDLNARVQLLNSKVDALSTGMAGIDQYLSNGSAKEYAMVDPAPGNNDAQAYGLLLANPKGEDAVLLAWDLDPTVDSYKVTIELSNGDIVDVSNLYTDNEGDAIQMLNLGSPLSQVTSIHVKPSGNGLTTDSQLASAMPDALYATIWPGLGREQDTLSGQAP